MKINSSIWNKFDNARIWLSLFVILNHCSPLGLAEFDGGDITIGFISITLNIRRIAVPAFFFISGFLTGHNHANDSIYDYKNLLTKRFKSLVIPYFLWNIIALCIHISIRLLLPNLCNTTNNWTSSLNIYNIFWTPEVTPLWFLRNLICFVILTPLLTFMVKKIKIFSCVLFFLLTYKFDIGGLFYYGLGLYFSMCVKNVNQIFTSKNIRYLLLIFIIYIFAYSLLNFTCIKFYLFFVVAHVCGIIGFINILSVTKHNALLFSQSLTFYIYCFHGIVSGYITTGLLYIIHPHGFAWYGYFWLIFAMVSVITILSWYILRRISPRLTSILTGGRNMQKHTPL